MKFLFWNIQKKSLINEIAELISESNCQIYAFAESSDEIIEETIKLLIKQYNIACYLYPNPGCEKIKIVIMGQVENITLLNQNTHYSLIKISGQHNELIVCFVHFPSKLHHTLNQLRRISELLRNQILDEENSNGISDTLVIGDFNVDPFEMPMISFTGMAATNGISCSQRESIVCDGEENRLFYNPMWTLYSSHKERPGTHKYIRTGEDVVSWHFLDQVIIRPTLIDRFKFESLKLVKKTKNYNYLNINQVPKLSDHLPLMCEIEF
ncbi:hypothetical protein [Candidatus Methylobacter oryzae]|uniref:Endonuclease/exonuclease/phosphatase domain-containing protein n=1 Tax=Candidatus Methylobacter oryzae TaxID=2497749 RepID=A0ABY3C7Y1_9GAMM|nr:hypothetical protein [Candidatus Methylobacter oryzae]TRW91484.1 hypothetical protein EKO24_016345 [Candidatus Methylobacter oryzae]